MILENNIDLEYFNLQMDMMQLEQESFSFAIQYSSLNENVQVIQEGAIESFKKIMLKIFDKIKTFIRKMINFVKKKAQKIKSLMMNKVGKMDPQSLKGSHTIKFNKISIGNVGNNILKTLLSNSGLQNMYDLMDETLDSVRRPTDSTDEKLNKDMEYFKGQSDVVNGLKDSIAKMFKVSFEKEIDASVNLIKEKYIEEEQIVIKRFNEIERLFNSMQSDMNHCLAETNEMIAFSDTLERDINGMIPYIKDLRDTDVIKSQTYSKVSYLTTGVYMTCSMLVTFTDKVTTVWANALISNNKTLLSLTKAEAKS
ncbi:MAG: hypothetical protein PHC62_00925 [Candidatus Izemoplasmatales bacterium]|nr:hypothetical protein [Candidatus Izemoplasmatales bacterium]